MANVLLFALFALSVLVVAMSIRVVPQGYEHTLERFGRYVGILSPGLNIILPFIDQIGRKVNLMEQVLDIPSQEAISKDNATVRVDGVVFFQIIDAAQASYQVHNLQIAISQLVMTNIRTVIGAMDLDELLSRRSEINSKLLSVIDHATSPWGVKVTRIELKDIVPPRDLVESMARQMKAEREKRAAILEAEGHRQAQVLTAEGEKQAAILEAEARKESAFRDAEARERLALAEANSTRQVMEASGNDPKTAMNYLVAREYLGTLKTFAVANNQKVILLPMEASGVLGSLAGIAELTKSALQNQTAG